MLKRLPASLTLFLCLLVAVPTAAGAAEPIEARWSFDGGVVEFVPDGDGWRSKVIQPRPNRICPEVNDKDGQIRLTGSGRNYSGTWVYFNRFSCQSVGNGSFSVTLDESLTKGTWRSAAPGGCCETSGVLERLGPISGDTAADQLEGELPPIVNAYLVEGQGYYAKINKAKKKKLRGLYASLRAWAAKARKRIAGYRAADSDEEKLKQCSTNALRTIAAAKPGGKSLTGGLQALQRCLRGYKEMFPGEKPGTELPKAQPVKPGTPPNKGRFVGGGKPSQVTRFDFTFNGSSITAVEFNVRTVCKDRRGKTTETGWIPSGRPGFATKAAADGTFSYVGRLAELNVNYDGVISGDRASGTIRLRGDFPREGVVCDSGVVNWYAFRKS